MDLSVVIVNWNVGHMVKRLLESLCAHTSGITFEIFVVDNNSGDGSVPMIRAEFPHVMVIANHDNRGFARANNQAIRESRGDFVLLLNPDTEIFDNSLGELVAWMRANPEAGIAGCMVLNTDRTLQRTIRRFPTMISQALIMLKLHHLFPRTISLTRYFAYHFDYTRQQEVDQVIGAFFCIRRAVIEKIGLMDERFFLWYEEVDYCKQAQSAGFKIFYTPRASIIHHGGESFAQILALRKQRYMNHGLRLYARKQWGYAAYLFFTILSPISLFLAWLVELLHIKPTAYKRIV